MGPHGDYVDPDPTPREKNPDPDPTQEEKPGSGSEPKSIKKSGSDFFSTTAPLRIRMEIT